MMIYDKNGKEIKVRHGVRVPRGSMVCRTMSGDWETTVTECVVVVQKSWDNLCQSHEATVELKEVA